MMARHALIACALVLFISPLIQAVPIWINAETGQVVADERPQVPGLWPDADGYCQEYVDAMFLAHDQRYEVPEVFVDEASGAGNEYVASTRHKLWLIDAQRAVSHMYQEGVWAVPHSCSAVNHMFLSRVISPLIHDVMPSQIKGVQSAAVHSTVTGYLTARSHGVVLDFECRDPQNTKLPPELRYEFHVCEADEYIRLTKARQSQMIQIRNDRERTYPSGQ